MGRGTRHMAVWWLQQRGGCPKIPCPCISGSTGRRRAPGATGRRTDRGGPRRTPPHGRASAMRAVVAPGVLAARGEMAGARRPGHAQSASDRPPHGDRANLPVRRTPGARVPEPLHGRPRWPEGLVLLVAVSKNPSEEPHLCSHRLEPQYHTLLDVSNVHWCSHHLGQAALGMRRLMTAPCQAGIGRGACLRVRSPGRAARLRGPLALGRPDLKCSPSKIE